MNRLRKWMAVGSLLLAGIAQAQQGRVVHRDRHDALIARHILTRLDLNSFPNSTGPRRTPDAHTPAQYGFTTLSWDKDGWAYATETDDPWMIGVLVLDDQPKRKRLCFSDTAQNGGTYRTMTMIEVVPERGGLWRAADPHAANRRC